MCARCRPQQRARHTFFPWGIQAINSAHSCVRSRIHFEICFTGNPKSKLVLPLRGTIYYREHLFSSDELFITRSIYFSMKQSLVRKLSPMLLQAFPSPLYTTRRIYTCPLLRGRCMRPCAADLCGLAQSPDPALEVLTPFSRQLLARLTPLFTDAPW